MYLFTHLSSQLMLSKTIAHKLCYPYQTFTSSSSSRALNRDRAGSLYEQLQKHRYLEDSLPSVRAPVVAAVYPVPRGAKTDRT